MQESYEKRQPSDYVNLNHCHHFLQGTHCHTTSSQKNIDVIGASVHMHGSLTFFLFLFVNKSVQSLPNTLYFGILVHLKEYSDSKKCEILLLLLIYFFWVITFSFLEFLKNDTFFNSFYMPYVISNKHHSIAKPNQSGQIFFWKKTFERELERKILQLQLLETNPENSLIWFSNSSGKFSWKSNYQVSQLGRVFENKPQAWAEPRWRVGGPWPPQIFEIFLNIYIIILMFSKFSLQK